MQASNLAVMTTPDEKYADCCVSEIISRVVEIQKQICERDKDITEAAARFLTTLLLLRIFSFYALDALMVMCYIPFP